MKNEQEYFYDNTNGQFYSLTNTGEKNLLTSSIKLISECRNDSGQDWSMEFEIKDPDERVHLIYLKRSELTTDTNAVMRKLTDSGFKIKLINTSFVKTIIQQLNNLSTECRKTISCVCGWNGNGFITPSYNVGIRDDIAFLPEQNIQIGTQLSGSKESWKCELASHCIGHKRLELALALAFVGPLLKLLELPNFGVHFYGPSSCGKTLAAKISASVWSNPKGHNGFIQSWKNTMNAIEGIAYASNDNILILDEIAEISPYEIGNIIYMLGNGAGKGRANITGFTKSRKKFQLIFLSNGEETLETLSQVSGIKIKGGHEVRFIELEADLGKGNGIFEGNINFNSSKELANFLEKVSSKEFGTAGKKFLESLTSEVQSNLKSLINRLENQRREFIDSIKIEMNPQVNRVLDYFATITTAGELAIDYQVLPFNKEVFLENMRSNFFDWFNSKDRTHLFDDQKVLDQIKAILQEWGDSMFSNLAMNSALDVVPIDNGSSTRSLQKYGYRGMHFGVECFFVTSRVFKEVFCKGFNHKRVAHILQQNDFMVNGPENKAYINKTIGSRSNKYYAIKASILEE